MAISSTSLINTLAQVATSGAQAQSQFQLKLIGDQLTAQLNRKIADLKAASNDPMLPILQQQADTLNKQKTSYQTAESQMVANGTPISDMLTRLATMTTAASAGDSTTFDQALSAAKTDLGIINVVTLLPGFQPDNASSLKVNGLGIQSSAAYNLATPTGQAQAAADISAAQFLVNQLSTITTQNIQVAVSVGQALDTQINAIDDQVSKKQQSELANAATQIQQLQQKTQTEFHLIELDFGNTSQNTTMLQQFEAAQAANAAPGSILDVLDTQLSGASSTTTSSSKTSSSTSSSVSTLA